MTTDKTLASKQRTIKALLLVNKQLSARVAELEAENTTLRAHRCEVGLEDPDAFLEHLKSCSPEEIETLNQFINRRER